MKTKTDIKAGYAELDLENPTAELSELPLADFRQREEMEAQKPNVAMRTGRVVTAILE